MKANHIRQASMVILAGVVLTAVSSVSATPIIVVGPGGAVVPYELLEDTPGQWIEISISGGDAVEACNFNAQIGDGGPALDGTPGPVITAVDLEGSAANPTIFFGSNDGQVDLGSFPQLAMLVIATESGAVSANGVLARLEIDTTGFSGDKTWTLALNATVNDTTDFGLIDADITDGEIHIPEPASFVLLSLCGLVLIRRRRA